MTNETDAQFVILVNGIVGVLGNESQQQRIANNSIQNDGNGEDEYRETKDLGGRPDECG